MRVLAIDPGGTTGMAFYDSLLEDFDAWAVEGQMPAVEKARMWISSSIDTVVCEEFRITPKTGQKSRGGSMTAIEIIGALRWITYARGVPFHMQTPSEAKSFMTDEKLKALGWYRPGKDHARDAARHLALYLVKNGHVSAEVLLSSVAERRTDGSS